MAAQSLTNLQSTIARPPNRSNLHERLKPHVLKPYSSENSFSGRVKTTETHWTKLSLQSSIPSTRFPTCGPISATVLSSLPTAKPERFDSPENVPKWSWRAIKAFSLGSLEARKLRYSNTGTESLLMGILIEGTSVAAKRLWVNGITISRAREVAIKLLEMGDFHYCPPMLPPLTKDAQRALDWAVDHKLKSGEGGELTTTDLLLGIWAEPKCPGHKVLAILGFNDEKAKELESSSSGPEFQDG